MDRHTRALSTLEVLGEDQDSEVWGDNEEEM